jgi:hypothetical protein
MSQNGRQGADLSRGEARWPMVAAVLAAMVLTAVRPDALRLGPPWLLPLIESVLLAALIVGDPGRINRLSALLRALSIGVVAVLALDTMISTGLLIAALINGGQATQSATELLSASAGIWGSNVIVFALLYWELDSGGAARRAHDQPRSPDLAFPQQLSPDVAPPGWRPRFIDYLYVGVTASTAFSPTDAMPLAPWTKIAMGTQSLISLALLGLVVARAVNVLT